MMNFLEKTEQEFLNRDRGDNRGTVSRKDFEDLRLIVGKLTKRIETLEKENATLINENKLIKEENNATKIESWSTVAKKKKPKQQLIVMNAVAVEQEQKRLRKGNIVVVGVPESTKKLEKERDEEDTKVVRNLFSQIGMSDIETTYIKRFKTRNKDKPAPILLDLKWEDDRNKVLKASFKLRENVKTKDIYFNPYLTEAEKLLDYELRKERNSLNSKLDANSPFRFGIRSSQIVKIKRK